jgi:hypothetical protein
MKKSKQAVAKHTKSKKYDMVCHVPKLGQSKRSAVIDICVPFSLGMLLAGFMSLLIPSNESLEAKVHHKADKHIAVKTKEIAKLTHSASDPVFKYVSDSLLYIEKLQRDGRKTK